MAKTSGTRAPVFFIGHGSPMNALADNDFTQILAKMRERFPNPKAVLCVSAHWLTEGTWVTHMSQPRTIHDFFGFPQALFDIQYPAPGSPEVADLVRSTVKDPEVQADGEIWGLDHGTWSVLRHVFPEANTPVIQLSINIAQPPSYHFELGKQLAPLRDQGVLIVGSGNIVHNLRRIRWEPEAEPYDWAIEFDERIAELIRRRDMEPILSEFNQTEAGRQSVPTTEHYFPMLYVLGASDERDKLNFEFEGIQNGSISMRTFSMSSDGD